MEKQILSGENEKLAESFLQEKKYYDIVNVQLTSPSFSWANGFYAVIQKKEFELRFCQIDANGNPHLFSDGRFMITCTGSKNPEVIPTSLKLLF